MVKKKTKKVIVILSVVMLVPIIVMVSVLWGIGYFSYISINMKVVAPEVMEDGTITIMSANIRRQEKFFSTSPADTGKNRWYRRASVYLENIKTIAPDIFGAQEVLPEQYNFLLNHLEGYGSVVTYRDNNGARSESCPLFYNEKRFDLLESGTFWLSETPEVMSKSWDCSQYRISTFIKLKDLKTEQTVAVFNAHPDWGNVEARVNQISVLAQKAQSFDADKVIVLGDMNSDRSLPRGNEGLSYLDSFLKDSKTFPGMTDYGPTCNEYGLAEAMTLDYIFLPETSIVKEVGKIDLIKNGVYPSDHFPIYAKVIL